MFVFEHQYYFMLMSKYLFIQGQVSINVFHPPKCNKSLV